MSDEVTKNLQIHVPENSNNDKNEIPIDDLNPQRSVLNNVEPAGVSEINDSKDADLEKSEESGKLLKMPSELSDGKSTEEMPSELSDGKSTEEMSTELSDGKSTEEMSSELSDGKSTEEMPKELPTANITEDQVENFTEESQIDARLKETHEQIQNLNKKVKELKREQKLSGLQQLINSWNTKMD